MPPSGTATVVFTMLIGWLLSRSLVQRVGSVVIQVETSSAELQTAANQQVSGAREQSTAMTQITTTMTELLATSRQISDGAVRVSQIAGQTGAAARVHSSAPHGAVQEVEMTNEDRLRAADARGVNSRPSRRAARA